MFGAAVVTVEQSVQTSPPPQVLWPENFKVSDPPLFGHSTCSGESDRRHLLQYSKISQALTPLFWAIVLAPVELVIVLVEVD